MMVRRWPLMLALALTACTGHGKAVTSVGVPISRQAVQGQVVEPPDVRAGAGVAVAPPVATRRLIETTGAGTLTGTVALNDVTDPFFADSAALHLLAMPAAHALVTLTTLDDEVYTKAGAPITATADAAGAFTFAGVVPTDKAFVLTALLGGDHRLSAIVPAGAATATLNEATSAVVELARWQLPAAA
ncbi:MAG: hypothetical protein JWM80_6414, partial [Cyanobacteria bacterium RYN_339]|nr:hypothetical protein [Cyanobacteria bacterium RYN_339]